MPLSREMQTQAVSRTCSPQGGVTDVVLTGWRGPWPRCARSRSGTRCRWRRWGQGQSYRPKSPGGKGPGEVTQSGSGVPGAWIIPSLAEKCPAGGQWHLPAVTKTPQSSQGRALTSVPLERSSRTKGKTPKIMSIPLLSAKIKAHLWGGPSCKRKPMHSGWSTTHLRVVCYSQLLLQTPTFYTLEHLSLWVWTAANSQQWQTGGMGLPDGVFAQGLKTASSSWAVFETGLSNSSNKTSTCQLKPGLTPVRLWSWTCWVPAGPTLEGVLSQPGAGWTGFPSARKGQDGLWGQWHPKMKR